MPAAIVARTRSSTLSLREALSAVQDPERRCEASAAICEIVKSSIEHVALRWHERGTLNRWHDLDDLCQQLRVILLTRVVTGFRPPEGKPDGEVERNFGRYAIVVLENYLRDISKHARRNRTMHALSLDAPAVRTDGGGDDSLIDFVEDGRNYPNLSGGLDEREMWGALRAKLTDESARVAYLRYEGKSWEEIGALMGEKPRNLQVRMRRCAAPVIRSVLARWMS